jgi:DNA invertase Pin-like site-specific DNA recombinase
MCRAVAARAGKRLTKTYLDCAKSGMAIPDRSQLALLMDDAKRGRFNYLVVSDLERLARSLPLANNIVETLLSYGITLILRDGGRNVSVRATDPTSATREAANLIQAVVAGSTDKLRARRRRDRAANAKKPSSKEA